ncbi:MAG: ribosome small subunit-dependent GTPase A [Pseudomonadota bacterium]
MNFQQFDLADYGWSPFFSSQLSAEELADMLPVRVMAVHRGGLDVAGPSYEGLISPFAEDAANDEAVATVGDWLLIEPETRRPRRLLDRKSLFKRRAPGTDRRVQLIAANVDTLLIVSSCNQDFNEARLERYLALARDADVMPVIVLSKADLAEDAGDFAQRAGRLLPGLLVETINALDPDEVSCLEPWCGKGQTVALVGSSGVGKTTLVNTLMGTDSLATQGIRQDDAKGRHTTTGRALHHLPSGGWLMDTPGMRELQLTDARDGVDEVFADVVEIAAKCRFSDCQHGSEPGCAVQAAIVDGSLDSDRLRRWKKLAAEDAYNSSSLAERRAKGRAFGKMVRGIMKEKDRGKWG